jgi:hypothetical protein
VVLRGHVERCQASRPGCLEEDSGQAGIERFNQARTRCSAAQLVAVAMTRSYGRELARADRQARSQGTRAEMTRGRLRCALCLL